MIRYDKFTFTIEIHLSGAQHYMLNHTATRLFQSFNYCKGDIQIYIQKY